MKELLYKFLNRLTDFIFRRRSIGQKLIGYGFSILIASLGINWLAKLQYRNSNTEFSFDVSSGNSIPQLLVSIGFCIGIILIVVGLVIVIFDYIRDARKDARMLAIVLELRGLHSSPDTLARDAELDGLPRQRQWLQIDFRPRRADELVDPNLLLERVESIKPSIETLSAGKDHGDIVVAIGGLAAVPALFLAGALLDDESKVNIFDWHRDAKKWAFIEGQDDGGRTHPIDCTELVATTQEVVLAISFSYPADIAGIRKTFPNLPLIQLRAKNISPDVYWSSEKQQLFVSEFRKAISFLMEKQVNRIHLVLVSPASLAIRLGMAYDQRLMPELLVYQYERTSPTPFPWSIKIPSHGKSRALVVHTNQENE